ncbi:hypothetical protein SAMN05444267_10075 [Chryseobacterium polytrichastri]|uniref:Uncharacterized protein n=1 Tax=Chryseobacterium polytrichastri TaxID=1302687 RepID=A0A1M6UPZ8_9FLAO|nr:hypothetical protein SAMN05444267_10075 [Chryseobacterium polytrichastri]
MDSYWLSIIFILPIPHQEEMDRLLMVIIPLANVSLFKYIGIINQTV